MNGQLSIQDTFPKLTPHKVLEKEDKLDGWIYICPTCKTYICGEKQCRCGQELDYSPPRIIYKGRYRY